VGANPGAYAHKPKIQKLQMAQSRCVRMTGRYPRTTNVNSLYADFPVLKMDEYLEPLAANATMNFHPKDLIR
jgi:hypothetical protein